MRFYLLILFCLSLHLTQAQTTITGKVKDEKGNPFAGANVFLKGAYDGVSTTADGTFSFKTEEK